MTPRVDATLLAHEVLPGNYHLLRLHAPALADAARPGCYVEIPEIALSALFILRADPPAGWVELLWPAATTPHLQVGQVFSVSGPLGQPLVVHPDRPRPLLLGSGQGIAPLIFLADQLRHHPAFNPLVILGSENSFPFTPRPSRFIVPGMPHGVIATPPLLDDWGIPARLASAHGSPGCFDGEMIALVRIWLETLTPAQRAEVELFASGPQTLLAEVETLAQEQRLPYQLV